MTEYSWNPDQTQFTIAILWSVVGFMSYYFLSRNNSFVSRIWKANRSPEIQLKEVLLQRFWGLLFMGILSGLIVAFVFREELQNFGVSLSFQAPPPWWFYLILPAILVSTYFSAPKPGNLALYPQIRIKQWTPGFLVLSSISWVAYLIGYEMLFRGFLLNASLTLLEPLPAIALNCTLYSFAHLYKGPQEAFGAIPFGVLLCYLTLLTGNIWTAVVLHSIMALSNEWFSIWLNPELSVKGKW